MSYRNALKLTTTTLIGALCLASAACATTPPTQPPWPTLWMAQSAGIWKTGDDYGYYKVLVFKQIMEHSRDRVLVQITGLLPPEKGAEVGTEVVLHSFWLDTPGIKGYIDAIHFQMIDDQRMALMLDIRMRGMDEVVLRELYVLHPDGTYKLLQSADQIDLFQ
jgi:hypothetical protein